MSQASARNFQLIGPIEVTSNRGFGRITDPSGAPTFFMFDGSLFECPEGGTVGVSNNSLPGFLGDFFGPITVINANNCGFNEIIVSGTIDFGISDPDEEQALSAGGVEIESSADESQVTAFSDHFLRLRINNNEVVSQSWSVNGLFERSDESVTEASFIGYNSRRFDDSLESIDVSAFRVVASLLDGEIDIDTIDLLNTTESVVPGEPVAGSFTVTGDTFEWIIDADGGDPAGFLDLIYWILLVRMLVSDRDFIEPDLPNQIKRVITIIIAV